MTNTRIAILGANVYADVTTGPVGDIDAEGQRLSNEVHAAFAEKLDELRSQFPGLTFEVRG